MKILIFGNLGYVGSVLTKHLRSTRPHAQIHGIDIGYFAHCLTGAVTSPEVYLDQQFYHDVRKIRPELFNDCDAIVLLAALSNDPIGDRFEAATKTINEDATIAIAQAASRSGVKNIVFASSCSIYGIAQGGPRKETDAVNPITAYARSKIAAEVELGKIEDNTVITCLRFATACGMSDRLRLDLVLNDYVACALTTGNITVLSDGTPWRPLIDVADMAQAIDWALDRSIEQGGRFLVVNAGSNSSNYQVKDLALAVSEAIPGVNISINHNAPVDSRSYQASFDLYKTLAPNHQPKISLGQSVRNLIDGMRRMGFDDANFRTSDLIRLRVLQSHMDSGRLNRSLEWTHKQTGL